MRFRTTQMPLLGMHTCMHAHARLGQATMNLGMNQPRGVPTWCAISGGIGKRGGVSTRSTKRPTLLWLYVHVSRETSEAMAKEMKFDARGVLPHHYYCMFCSELMEEPHLTDCCGYHFCKNCITKQHTCPHCKGKPTAIIPDRQLEAAINGIKIPCTHSGKGCLWTGLPSKLDKHLNKEQLAEGSDYCDYELLRCDCAEEHRRKDIYKHKVDECCQRITCCDHCGIMKKFFELEYHFLRCTGYPVECPYECGITTLKRRDKRRHSESCGEVEVKCPSGCKGKLKRKELKMHLWKNQKHHRLLSEESRKAGKRKLTSRPDSDSDSEQEEFVKINRTPRHPRKHAKIESESEDDAEEEFTTPSEALKTSPFSVRIPLKVISTQSM